MGLFDRETYKVVKWFVQIHGTRKGKSGSQGFLIFSDYTVSLGQEVDGAAEGCVVHGN